MLASKATHCIVLLNNFINAQASGDCWLHNRGKTLAPWNEQPNACQEPNYLNLGFDRLTFYDPKKKIVRKFLTSCIKIATFSPSASHSSAKELLLFPSHFYNINVPPTLHHWELLHQQKFTISWNYRTISLQKLSRNSLYLLTSP